MRASPVEYLGLKLRAHEVLHDVPLYDVSVVDLPGGGAGRSVADIRALDATLPPSRSSRSDASSCTRPCCAGFVAPGSPPMVLRRPVQRGDPAAPPGHEP